MSRWFRWYEGTSEDTKFRLVSRMSRVTVRDVLALWTLMLENASRDEHRGVCTRMEDYLSAALDFEEGIIERILEAMEDAGLISVGHGAITICKWGERQFETDGRDATAAERQRRRRERIAAVTRDETVTARDVTPESRPDTDTDTDTEKKETRDASALAFALEAATDFEIFWTTYPEKVGKKVAAKSYLSARRTADAKTILDGLVRYIKRKPADRPWLNPATFLNQQRWEDQPAGSVEAPITCQLVNVLEGTPEMDAWDRHWRQTKGVNAPRSKHGGIFVETQWPPGVDHAWDSNADQSPRA